MRCAARTARLIVPRPQCQASHTSDSLASGGPGNRRRWSVSLRYETTWNRIARTGRDERRNITQTAVGRGTLSVMFSMRLVRLPGS